MAITADALRRLHRIHRQLGDLKDRLSRGPKLIKASEGNLAKVEGEYDEKKETLTRAKVACDEKQLQLKQREDRIKDLQAKLNTASSNREYQALKEQIAADEQANSVLSDEILEDGGNIEDSRMAVLGGAFTIIMLVAAVAILGVPGSRGHEGDGCRRREERESGRGCRSLDEDRAGRLPAGAGERDGGYSC